MAALIRDVSNTRGRTNAKCYTFHADEVCRLRSVSFVGEWLSLVEHLVRDQGVGGSNPLSPTNFKTKPLTRVSCLR
jgi:hypothetical protein